MKFIRTTPKLPDLTKVASKDKSRPVLSCAYLDTERQVIEATDSYRLVSIPVEIEEGDVSGLIPIEAMKAFQKAHKKTAIYPSLVCRETEVELVNHYDGTAQTWKRKVEGTFPNVPELIPEDVHPFRIGLNAKLLGDLAAGMGTETVEIQFVADRESREPSALRPMIVRPLADRAVTGILMPVRLAS